MYLVGHSLVVKILILLSIFFIGINVKDNNKIIVFIIHDFL